MITARPQKNLAAAKAYFAEHLTQGDYYAEGQAIAGMWFGEGVQRLGLDGARPVTLEAFTRLCENRHPLTGERLTVRQKSDRRACYDFVVSAPKSVSIVALTLGDARLVEAHERACLAAMQQLQECASAYVRKGGKGSRRVTGEVVAAAFRHDCSRALDPQMHTHFVIFNATWDESEARWKALEPAAMFERLQFATEVYRSALAFELRKIGYALRTTNHGFEIAGVPQEIIERFSKRRRAIAEAEAKLAEKLGRPLTNNARASLAHSRRQRKIKHLAGSALREYQRAQLSEEELRALQQVVPGARAKPVIAPRISVQEALDFACSHLFERRSVVTRHELLEEALRFGRGEVTLKELDPALLKRTDLVGVGSELTTRETVWQERRIITMVNEGIESCRPLNLRHAVGRGLSNEQEAALRAILSSQDRVMVLRGGAGTGKTRLMQEVVRGIEDRRETLVLAPSAAAVEVLRKSGFTGAMTVQRLLVDPAVQESARGKVLVVDEAGLISTRQMFNLLELAHARDCRVLLSGDSRQHTSIEAGDALRILERFSALRIVELKTVRRQVEAEYRRAVGEIAQGRPQAALLRLERLGAVAEFPDGGAEEQLATDYRQSIAAGKSALIVCPTWREIERVTEAVRCELKRAERLSDKETLIETHHPLRWTSAQKRDLRLYKPGHVLLFHKATKEFGVGDWAEVIEVRNGEILVRNRRARMVSLTGKQARCFDVAEKVKLPVAPGERLLLQGNRKAEKLFNGQIVAVKKIEPSGRIHLADGRSLKPDFKTFTHGYAVTSPGSQARTVDHVLVSVKSDAVRATNLKQFYVSVSRGRERVKIYTDDKSFLREAVTAPGTRLSALELFERHRRFQSVREISAIGQTPRPRIGV